MSSSKIPKTLTEKVDAWNRNRQKYNKDLIALSKMKRTDTKTFREKKARLVHQRSKLMKDQKEIERMAERHGVKVYGGR